LAKSTLGGPEKGNLVVGLEEGRGKHLKLLKAERQARTWRNNLPQQRGRGGQSFFEGRPLDRKNGREKGWG